jgi:CrcB protein
VKIAAIALAGAAGALSRYGLGLLFPHPGPTPTFPLGTFIVNVSGSFVAGVSIVLLVRFWPGNEVIAAGVLVGFLGAYTTFSALTLQVQRLVDGGASSIAFAYVLTSVVAGISAAFGGVGAGKLINRLLPG